MAHAPCFPLNNGAEQGWEQEWGEVPALSRGTRLQVTITHIKLGSNGSIFHKPGLFWCIFKCETMSRSLNVSLQHGWDFQPHVWNVPRKNLLGGLGGAWTFSTNFPTVAHIDCMSPLTVMTGCQVSCSVLFLDRKQFQSGQMSWLCQVRCTHTCHEPLTLCSFLIVRQT